MKYILLLLIFLPTFAISQQQKNKIFYKGGVITQEMVQNYLGDEERTIQDKVLGVDAQVIIDTIFKKYIITFEDDKGERIAMIYDYVRDYYIDDKSENKNLNKIYKMKFGGVDFKLTDYLSTAPFFDLEILYEKKLPNNITLLHRVKNLKKVLQ